MEAAGRSPKSSIKTTELQYNSCFGALGSNFRVDDWNNAFRNDRNTHLGHSGTAMTIENSESGAGCESVPRDHDSKE